MLKIRDDVDLKELQKLTKQDFINYVKQIRNSEITNVAPLGFSGEDLIIFENKNKPLHREFVTEEEYNKADDGKGYGSKEWYNQPVWRSCQLSMRKYGNECELLITDYKGNFLTCSKLHLSFSDKFIGETFFRIFSDLKKFIPTVVNEINIDVNWDKVKLSDGFDILECYQKKKVD